MTNLNEEQIKEVTNLLSSPFFEEKKYLDERLQKKIREYAKKKFEENPNSQKYDFNESDLNEIIEDFIYGRARTKAHSYLLLVRYDFEEEKLKLKSKIEILLSSKKDFKSLWHENVKKLKSSLLDIFKSKKDISLNKLELASLFLKHPIVENINSRNYNFISNLLTTEEWGDSKTTADFKITDLINKIRNDFRSNDEAEGYIVWGNNLEMSEDQILDGEKLTLTTWKYTENWREIKEFCYLSGIKGGKRMLDNLFFLIKNKKVEDISSELKAVQGIINKISKEINEDKK